MELISSLEQTLPQLITGGFLVPLIASLLLGAFATVHALFSR